MSERNMIYLCLAHMSEEGAEQKYVKEAFDTNWVVPMGPNVNAFEQDLANMANSKTDGSEPLDRKVVCLSAGTAAVHLALIACGVKAGDEVLVQSFTFCASSHPITYLGAKPVFVGSERDTWNMDPELLEKAIIDRKEATGEYPKAIIPVALYGMPYDCEEIMAIAEKYNIPVIEDAAEGMGSRFDGQVLGTFGKYGVLSFNGNKMITTSGGGALICQNKEDANEIMWYATQARDAYPYYQHTAIGYNYRMSNICAGIGRGQMTVAQAHIDHHKHVQALYEELLADVEGVGNIAAVGEPVDDGFVQRFNALVFDGEQTADQRKQLLQPVFLQPHIVVIVQIVQAHHGNILHIPQQRHGQICSDETGSTGNQNRLPIQLDIFIQHGLIPFLGSFTLPYLYGYCAL